MLRDYSFVGRSSTSLLVRQNMLIGLSMLTHVTLQGVVSPKPLSFQSRDTGLGNQSANNNVFDKRVTQTSE
jgi:hypothetical protein